MWKMSSSLSVPDPTSKRSFWAFLGDSAHTADSLYALLIHASESRHLCVIIVYCCGGWWCVRGSDASTREFSTALCAQTCISLLMGLGFMVLGPCSLEFEFSALYEKCLVGCKSRFGAESQNVECRRFPPSESLRAPST